MSTTEIKTALDSLGAEKIVVIKLVKPLEEMTHMIIGTGKSPRHLVKMATTIVRAVSDDSIFAFFNPLSSL